MYCTLVTESGYTIERQQAEEAQGGYHQGHYHPNTATCTRLTVRCAARFYRLPSHTRNEKKPAAKVSKVTRLPSRGESQVRALGAALRANPTRPLELG